MRSLGSAVRWEAEELDERRPTENEGTDAAARYFYETLLGGRQVWPNDHHATIGRLWFLFGETLVEAGPSICELGDVLEVEVDSPNDAAARCWDAGYTVRLLRTGGAGSLSVIDPFGRMVALVPRR